MRQQAHRPVFVIDGYNVIKRGSALFGRFGGAPEQGRAALAAYCAEWLALRRDAREFVLVFDGDDSVAAPAAFTASRGVRLLFTRSRETADARIAEILGACSRPSLCTVVSDDRSVTDDARRAGASVLTVAAFCGTLPLTRGRRITAPPRRRSGLSPREEASITASLMREWGLEHSPEQEEE